MFRLVPIVARTRSGVPIGSDCDWLRGPSAVFRSGPFAPVQLGLGFQVVRLSRFARVLGDIPFLLIKKLCTLGLFVLL